MVYTLTVARLKEILRYNPVTGKLYWVVQKGPIAPGTEAGHLHSCGYIIIEVDGIRICAHIAAYALMLGCWPKCTLDHKDLDKSNNIWTNLREASLNQQQYNKRRQSNNTSGFKGVSWDKSKNKWAAGIRWEGKRRNLGAYPTAELAYEAYKKAAKELHGDFVRLH